MVSGPVEPAEHWKTPALRSAAQQAEVIGVVRGHPVIANERVPPQLSCLKRPLSTSGIFAYNLHHFAPLLWTTLSLYQSHVNSTLAVIIKGHCQTVTNIYHRIKCVFGKILGTAILFCNGCIRFFKDFMSVVLPSYHPSNDSISESFCKKWFTSRIQVKNSWPIFINDFYMPLTGSTRKKNLK